MTDTAVLTNTDAVPEIPVLECRDLCISYFTRAGEVPAVKDFNLVLNQGQSIGLVGESGCGKTTVALAIMQYLGGNGRITGGEILYKGRNLGAMTKEELRHLRGNEIAMVYQEPMESLNPSITLGKQLIEVPMCHDGIGEDEAYGRALDMLSQVKLPDPERIMNAYLHQVSGGQQQRVVIAMALLSKPSLLLLDEPTTALDVTVEAGIIDLISDLVSRFNTSIVYVSHNLGLVLETCDRVCIMYSGLSVEVGTVSDVFASPRHPYTRGLFDAIPLPSADRRARPLTPIRGQLPLPTERPPGCYFGPRCDYFQAGICDADGLAMQGTGTKGHDVRCARWNKIDLSMDKVDQEAISAVEIGDTVLDVARLKKHYEVSAAPFAAMLGGGNTRILKANEDISLTARRAETVAIVGESGCGKTTFAKVLMGLETATDGAAAFLGSDIANSPVQGRPASLISALQMVFQNPFDTLNPSHTVGGQLARVIKIFNPGITRDQIDARTRELLDLVKLPHEFAKRRPRQLSGGQKQRVGIARAFAGKPAMVVADEPVSALDVSVQAAITCLLQDIQREFGTTLLLISHDLSLVRYLADRVVVVYLGRVMEKGKTADVFSPPYHPYTEALLSAVPIADPRIKKKRIVLEGELPSAVDPPTGCPFHTRCHRRIEGLCDSEAPPVVALEDGHEIACHISREELAKMEPVIEVSPDSAGANGQS